MQEARSRKRPCRLRPPGPAVERKRYAAHRKRVASRGRIEIEGGIDPAGVARITVRAPASNRIGCRAFDVLVAAAHDWRQRLRRNCREGAFADPVFMPHVAAAATFNIAWACSAFSATFIMKRWIGSHSEVVVYRDSRVFCPSNNSCTAGDPRNNARSFSSSTFAAID